MGPAKGTVVCLSQSVWEGNRRRAEFNPEMYTPGTSTHTHKGTAMGLKEKNLINDIFIFPRFPAMVSSTSSCFSLATTALVIMIMIINLAPVLLIASLKHNKGKQITRNNDLLRTVL